MAKHDKLEPLEEETTPNIEKLEKRLDMLDQRLDHVDSIVSVVAERVMQQPITILIGMEKPSR